LSPGEKKATLHEAERKTPDSQGVKVMNLRSCGTENSTSNVTVLSCDEQPEIRVEKVLEIRRQLGEGTYSLADRLDVVIDRIIQDLA
jgi:anti-sigma28 factor (negative regulator of flagellin synthesis)